MKKESLIQEGASLYNKGEYTAALTYFMSLPDDSNVDSSELSYYLGLCYSKLKRYDDAILYLEQVVTSSDAGENEKVRERVLQCRYLLAVIYCISGRKKLADYELNKLLELGYKVSSVYASLGYMAWEQGNSEQSMIFYQNALDDDPENPTALNGMGYVLACQGEELTRALTCCKKAMDIMGETPAVLDSMGWVYYKMGLLSEAQKFLNRALKKDPSNVLILEHLQEVKKGEE